MRLNEISQKAERAAKGSRMLTFRARGRPKGRGTRCVCDVGFGRGLKEWEKGADAVVGSSPVEGAKSGPERHPATNMFVCREKTEQASEIREVRDRLPSTKLLNPPPTKQY